ncbi:MAG: nucleotidyltransferase domain-containing protein, partial [Dehalococcoidia bacterium]
MNVFTNDHSAQDFAIRRMRELVEADGRVRAAWLQGSFARGDQDAWSDVDFYVAVEDEAFEEFARDMRQHLEHLAPVVGAVPVVAFGRTRLIEAAVDTPEGLVLFDLFAEPVSNI